MVDWTASVNRIKQQNASSSAPSSNYLTGFVRNMMESVPELVGVNPTDQTEQWRADNPGSAFVSSLIPTALTYGGWYKASTKIPAVAKALSTIGVGTSPVIGGALREITRYAPLELGRIGLSAALGTGNTGDVARQAAANELLAGVAGGVGGLLRTGGPVVPPMAEISSEVNQADAIPLQLRQLREARAAGTVKNLDAADLWINRYSQEVKAESPADQPLIGKLEGGDKVPKELNRLMRRGSPSVSIARRQYIPQHWDSAEELKKALQNTGLEGNEHFVQFPRFVQPLNEKGAGEVTGSITKNLNSVGEDTWLGKEANDGLYVVAKRYEKGPPAAGPPNSDFAPGDKWTIFKTDQPEKFAPLSAEWTKKIISAGAWDLRDVSQPIGTELNDVLQKSKQFIGFRNFNDTAPESEWLAKIKKTLGVGPLQGSGGTAAKQAYNFVKEFGAPSTWQFSGSPRANYIFNVARSVYDAGQAIANGIMFGAQKLEGKYSLLNNVLLGAKGSTTYGGRPALNETIDALYENPNNVFDVWRAQSGGWDEAAVKTAALKGEISPQSAEFLNLFNTVDGEPFAELQKTQIAFGIEPSTALAGHRMISNTFRGTLRVPVFDEKGNLITLGSGKNAAEAIKEADFFVDNAKMEGRNWTSGVQGQKQKWFTSDSATDLQALLDGQPQARLTAGPNDLSLARALRERYIRGNAPRPATLRERQGMGGYIGQRLPWTKEEFKEIVSSHIGQYQKYQAELNIKNVFQSDLQKLANEDPRIYSQLLGRIDDLSGRAGVGSQLQNQIVDKAFAPYFGRNSATRMVAGINEATYHFTLGMMNLNFPAINALQFMQTALPHVSFISRAPKETIARLYSWAVASGADGMPRRSIGVLQMTRLLGRSFKELASPDGALLENMGRAQRDGVTDPKLIEEFAGQNSTTVQKLGSAFNSPGGIVSWIKAASSVLPSASERFSRTHAFVLGNILGRDFMNLEGDNLYQFSKMFTHRTMFGYSTVDRAKILSGPLGSAVGLYKNWQMHYLGWLFEYMHAATQGNVAPLLWMVGGTASVGGVAASPFYFAADGLSRMFANKSAMQLVYDNFGGVDEGKSTLSDSIYYGLPSFLNISLQGSAEVPGASPVRDAAMLFSIVQWQRAKELGKAVGSAVETYGATGEHPINDRATRDAFIQAFAPRSLVRLAQSTEDGVINSLNTGNSTAVASPAERVLYALGLNPLGVARQMAASEELYKNQAAMKAAVTKYGDLWFQAQEKQDWPELNRIMLRAMAGGVPLDSIVHSATARSTKQEEDAFSRKFKEEEIRKMTSIIGNR